MKFIFLILILLCMAFVSVQAAVDEDKNSRTGAASSTQVDAAFDQSQLEDPLFCSREMSKLFSAHDTGHVVGRHEPSEHGSLGHGSLGVETLFISAPYSAAQEQALFDQLQYVLKNGCDADTLVKGWPVLNEAIYYIVSGQLPSIKVARLLMDSGASLELVELQAWGATPLNIAISGALSSSIQRVEREDQATGSMFKQASSQLWLNLDVQSLRVSYDLIRLLVQYGAAVDYDANDGAVYNWNNKAWLQPLSHAVGRYCFGYDDVEAGAVSQNISDRLKSLLDHLGAKDESISLADVAYEAFYGASQYLLSQGFSDAKFLEGAAPRMRGLANSLTVPFSQLTDESEVQELRQGLYDDGMRRFNIWLAVQNERSTLQKDVIKLLVDAGADVDRLDSFRYGRDKWYTPLYQSLYNSCWSVSQILLDARASGVRGVVDMREVLERIKKDQPVDDLVEAPVDSACSFYRDMKESVGDTSREVFKGLDSAAFAAIEPDLCSK